MDHSKRGESDNLRLELPRYQKSTGNMYAPHDDKRHLALPVEEKLKIEGQL